MKKFLSIVLAVAMMLTMVIPAFANTFADIEDSDYKIAIERLTALGIVNGRTATTYEPDGIVTRAEMAKLLVVSLGLKTGAAILENTATFDDVPTTHWSVGYVNVAAQYGLIRGDGDGNFRPDDTVNYAEAVTMCIRALNYARVVDKAGEWPTNYLNKALELGLFDEVEFASAKDGANRGSIAQIIWNMVISPMWVVTQENEAEGIYYGKTGESMLDLKFPDYTVEEKLIFNDWSYDVEKGEYVVKVSLGNDVFKYEGNDFYTYVPRTEVEALIYKNEKVVSMYPTDNNYLAEGTNKALSDKYDNFGGTPIYAYLLLNSAKRNARIVNQVNALGNEIVKEVEHKDSTKYTTVKTDIRQYRIDDEEGVEAAQNLLLIKDGKRVDISKLKENDVITWFENDAEQDKIGIVSTATVKGQFNSIKSENDKLEAGSTITVKISGKDYEMNIGARPYFVELDKNDEEIYVDSNKLMVKEKDNDYAGEEVTAYLDVYGNIYKVAFGYVKGVVKNIGVYLVVDGDVRKVSTRTDAAYYITLANKDGEDGYALSDEIDNPEALRLRAGRMYWVELNADDEILDFIPVEDGAEYRDYDVDYVDEEYNDKTGYFGDKKVTDSTVIYTVVEKLKDDDTSYSPRKYELRVSNGAKALDGKEEGLVAYEDDSVRASFIVVEGEARSTNKLVGVLDKVTLESEVAYVTISGHQYEVKLPAGITAANAYTSLRRIIGSVVAYTLDDDKATIQFVYSFDELDRAGQVTKVTKEGTIFVYDPDSDTETEYDLDLFAIEARDGGLGFEDHTVVVITVAYDKHGDPYFESAEVVDGIDDVKFAKDDLIAVHTEDKLNYFAVIKGLDLDEYFGI